MRNIVLFLFFSLILFDISAQITTRRDTSNDLYRSDSTRMTRETQVVVEGDTNYKDYKIISIKNDTTIIDTTLTVSKEYKFNFLRQDNFELLEFHNQGQTFNKLGYDFSNNDILPAFGFDAKQFNYNKVEDIYYYSVPTPTSEFMYRRGIQQGQVMDALLTANTSRELNVALAYKGIRSLGKYKHELASQRNFKFTFNYHTKNKIYFVRGHIHSFYFFNEENGGLTDESIQYFENDDSNFKKRNRLEVNYTDADNVLEGKRYFLDHNIIVYSNNPPEKKPKKKSKKDKKIEEEFYKTDSISKQQKDSLKITSIKSRLDSSSIAKKVKLDSINKQHIDSLKKKPIQKSLDSIYNPKKIKKDSISIDSVIKLKPEIKQDTALISITDGKPLFNLKVGNTLMYETQHYRFNQETANSIFGDAFRSKVSDNTNYKQFNGQLYLQLNSAYIGSLKLKVNYFDYNYHYNSILFYDDYTISDKIQGSSVIIGADWRKVFGKIQLDADASSIVSGDFTGSTLKAAVQFQQNDLFTFRGYAEFTSKSPDFSSLLYQSDYIDYNWQNNFKNEDITSFGATFNSNKWVTVDASYNTVDNYAYFNENGRPEQSSETLNYYKIKVMKDFTVGKFGLANTVLYQNVASGDSFLRVPNWVTRNTFYFSTDMFKGDPLYLQTGITFRYFSSYYMNAYNPLVSEFTIQNEQKYGAYPMLDFFVNLRIQRTRIYLKLENFTSSFTGRDYYSAPEYPFRDFTFRFGVVWNFFI